MCQESRCRIMPCLPNESHSSGSRQSKGNELKAGPQNDVISSHTHVYSHKLKGVFGLLCFFPSFFLPFFLSFNRLLVHPPFFQLFRCPVSSDFFKWIACWVFICAARASTVREANRTGDKQRLESYKKKEGKGN